MPLGNDATPAPISQPLRAIPLEYAAPPKTHRYWPIILSLSLILAAICCVVAWILIVAHDVESVLVTGPILFSLGATALIGGILLKRRGAAGLGAAHCAVCVLFVALVNLMHWGPGQAREPFAMIGLFYSLLVVPMTVILMIWDAPTSAPPVVDSQPLPGHK